MAALFKAISIEDNLSDAKRLKDSISQFESVEYIDNATTIADGCTLLTREHPDLIFIDIELPDGNGIEAIDTIRKIVSWPIKIVIYTVYDHQAIDAIRKEAFDYLVKPLKREELMNMIDRLAADYRHREDEYDSKSNTASNNGSDSNAIVMVNTIMGYVPIRFADIVYAEHVDKTKYWRIYLTDGTSKMLRKGTTSSTILEMNKDFIQVNNRQIINLSFLGILKKDSCIMLPPYELSDIQVTRSYIAALQKRLLFV